MYFSIGLVTIPTTVLTYMIIKYFAVENSVYLLIILYYLYFFSTIFLWVAGATDPGILERNYVSYMGKIF